MSQGEEHDETDNFPPIQIQSARSSENCDMQTKIVFVDMDLIGVHEDTNHEKLKSILVSILRTGYKGPAISIMESANEGLFETATDQTQLNITKPFQVGIVDGHNRLAIFKILKLLGILNYQLIPAQLIPVQSGIVQTASLDTSKAPLSISQIQASNANPNSYLSQSETFFQIKLRSGEAVRVREGQPDITITPEELFSFSKFDPSVLDSSAEAISQYIPVNELKEILGEFVNHS